MARDTVRDDSAFQTATAELLGDNNTADIEPIDIRDMFATLRERTRVIGTAYSATATLSVDLSAAAVHYIFLTQNVSAVSFVNVPPVNLLWPSENITHANFAVGSATTVSAVNVLDAFGGSTADRLVMTNTSNTSWTFPFRAIAGAVYTFRVWLQNNANSGVSLDIESVAGSIQATTNASATANWGAFETVWTALTTDTYQVQLDNRANTTAVDVYVAHAGLFASDKTDYIPTTIGPRGELAQVRLILQQDGTGGRTVGWGNRVMWANSATAVLSTSASARDVVDLLSRDGGAEWFAVLSGKGF